jgi:hypothetical protein
MKVEMKNEGLKIFKVITHSLTIFNKTHTQGPCLGE